ncbi:hypothetical protein CLOM_g10800 [Closterium sp. NIES-68]|nr:hypothetical protein CLOM_g10800 [Closterium sp. NIES-68]GJP74570.1 hypothetical protein CLOP_g5129 [Closterium sp. NIES-67]
MAPDGSSGGGGGGGGGGAASAAVATAIDGDALQALIGGGGEYGDSTGESTKSGTSGAGAWEEPRSSMWEWRENWMVHYEVAGDETDSSLPAVLLLPGFGVGSFHFQHQLRGLAAGTAAAWAAAGAAAGAEAAMAGAAAGGQEGVQQQQGRHRVWAMDFFGQGKSWPAKDPAPFPSAPSAPAAPTSNGTAQVAEDGEEAMLLRAEEGRGKLPQGANAESRKPTGARGAGEASEAVADWGFGPKAEPWARDLVYGADMWCQQVADFIDQVIQEPVFIAGNSLGGYIAAYLAATRPHLCRGVLLLNATPFWAFAPNPAAPAPSLLARLYPFPWRGSLPVPALPRLVARRWWDSLRHPVTLRSLLALVYTDTAPLTADLIEKIAQPTQHPASAAAFASIVFAPKTRLSFDDNLASLTARSLPVCILHGKDDPWVGPMWAARAARALPHAAFFDLSPAGHCPHHERPEVVNYLISSWISHVHSGYTTPLPLSPNSRSTHSHSPTHSDSPSAPSLPSSAPSALPWSLDNLWGEGEWEEGVWIDGAGLCTPPEEKQGTVTEGSGTVIGFVVGSKGAGAVDMPPPGIRVRRHMRPPPHPIHLVDAAVETVSATWRRVTGRAHADGDGGRKKNS